MKKGVKKSVWTPGFEPDLKKINPHFIKYRY